MKLPKGEVNRSRNNRRQRHLRARENDHVTEMLKLCLQKICELQADLNNQPDDSVHDPEAAGYTACALETLRFLTAQGLSADHPMVRSLRERLLRDRD